MTKTRQEQPTCQTCIDQGVSHSDLACCVCGRTHYYCDGHAA